MTLEERAQTFHTDLNYEQSSAGAYNTERATSLYSYQGVFTNDFGVNFDYLLGPLNQSAKGKCLKMAFLTFK